MGFELVMRQPTESTYYDMVVSRNAGIKVVMFKYSIYLRMNPATNCGAQSAWIINIRFQGPPVTYPRPRNFEVLVFICQIGIYGESTCES